MKRILIISLVINFLHIYSYAQSHIYSAKGETVFFYEKPSDRMITFNKETPSEVITNTIDRLNSVYGKNNVIPFSRYLYWIHTQHKDYLELNNIVGEDSIHMSISPLLQYKDSTIHWCSNKIFIKLAPNHSLPDILRNQRIPFRSFRQIGSDERVFLVEIDGFIDRSVEYANKIFLQEGVEFAQPSFGRLVRLCNPYLSDQWGLQQASEVYGVNAFSAWGISTGEGVKVAVIDLGADFSHPDLQANLLSGYDAVDELEFHNENGACEQNNSHGTCCAGIIAAEDNDIGIKGIAFNSKIIPIRIGLQFFLPNGWVLSRIHDEWIVDGLYQAWSTLGADILSNSWGGGIPCEAMFTEISNAVSRGRDNKGCVVVFSSGNYYPNEPSTDVNFPANVSCDILAVGASCLSGERKDLFSCDGVDWGSCYGDELDVVAPGVAITTTDNSGTSGYNSEHPIRNQSALEDYENTDFTRFFGGTSAACPYVAGVAALVLSVNPNLTSSQVNHIIRKTSAKIRTDMYEYSFRANDIGSSWNNEMGHGLVDAYQAVLTAANPPAFPDLWLRDNTADNGCEPNETITQYNSSPDIWLTDQDGYPVYEPAVGQTCTVHVRLSNRSDIPSTSATLSLSWGISKTGYNSNNGRLVCPWVCNRPARGTVVADFPLGTIAAGTTAEYTFTWRVPNPATETCDVNLNDPWRVAFMACINDGNPTPGLTDGTIAADQQARLSNNVAWHSYPLEFNGLIVIIDEPLIPIFGAPASLTGGSSEADAELTWRGMDGTVLGTGESLDIVPTAATERYVLEGYSPSLDAYATDTLTLHPRLGAILAVSPNPVAGGRTEVSLRLAAPLGGATLQVVNNLGQALLVQPVAPTADGSATATLNLQGIPSGQYQLRLAAGTTLVDIHTLIVQ